MTSLHVICDLGHPIVIGESGTLYLTQVTSENGKERVIANAIYQYLKKIRARQNTSNRNRWYWCHDWSKQWTYKKFGRAA